MMPTSAPGASERRGFTLVELLVVLLIMGLFAGLVGAVVRPDERALLRVEAERLAQLLELAAEEARLTGTPIAWTAEPTRYRFWRRRAGGEWAEVQDDVLKARGLPSGLVISDLRVEAMDATGGKRLEFGPHVALAYELRMSLGTAGYAIAGSPLGLVRIDAY